MFNLDFFLVSITQRIPRGIHKNLRPPSFLGRFSFRGRWPRDYMQGINSIPILSLEWFVTFSEVVLIFLHMLSVGIKKGLLLFPSATLKTHLWRLMQLLQYGQQEYNRCYLRLWFLNLSLSHHLLIELSAAPSTNYEN